jgi:hypothetical protein
VSVTGTVFLDCSNFEEEQTKDGKTHFATGIGYRKEIRMNCPIIGALQPIVIEA